MCVDELVRVIIDELKMSDTSDIIQTELQADDSDSDALTKKRMRHQDKTAQF